MKMEGKAALVTGASRGIGKAIALELAAQGGRVAVNYRNGHDAADATVAAIRQLGRDAFPIQANVGSLEEVRAMAAAVMEKFGRIDILVNNAGIIRDSYLTFTKPEDWNEVLNTNLTGAFNTIKTLGRDMMRQHNGRIVNIASDAGLMGDLMRGSYAAAKAGLIGLTRTAAREFAGSGVTVNAICPGIIETAMTADMPATRRDKQMESIPQRRFGMPEEVAKAVAFLASDDAAYITGEVLCVDGGLHM